MLDMDIKSKITRDKILPLGDYEEVREERRDKIVALKKTRRMEIGPHATCNFECYDTMWWQIHEMLRIENGGDAQIDEELTAYNPLIPNGNELVCTVMFEIPDSVQRRAVLATLGGIEETMFLKLDGETLVNGVSEKDLDRTTASGKASSVQFIHFPFLKDQIVKFRAPSTEVVVGFSHPNYAHMTIMSDATHSALTTDFF